MFNKKKILTFTMSSMLMLNSMTGIAFAQTANDPSRINLQLHETILQVPSIVKDNTTYVSLRDFANSLGFEIRWDKEADTVKVYMPETMPSVYITNIDKQNNRITVSTNFEDQKPENMFVFHIFEDTYGNEDSTIQLDDFKVGDKVIVKHAKKMAHSLPPQSTAYRITKEQHQIQEAKIIKNDLKAKEITAKYVDEQNQEKTTTFTYDDKTIFTHNGLTKQLLVPNDYKTGDTADITFTINATSQKPHITVIKKLIDN